MGRAPLPQLLMICQPTLAPLSWVMPALTRRRSKDDPGEHRSETAETFEQHASASKAA